MGRGSNAEPFNAQKELLPLMTMTGEAIDEVYFLPYLADLCRSKPEAILSYELSLYPVEKGRIFGLHNEFLGSPRLDNLTSVAACLRSIIRTKADGLRLALLFDNEEVGSTTKQGAASQVVPDLLRRIYAVLGFTEEEYTRQCARAFLLSVDVAHAYHPNYPEKNDLTNFPVLGGGVVLKTAASQTYAGDAEAVAVIKSLAEAHDIPCQIFVNRSDMRGGSTLGSLLSARLPVRTMDIGAPLLSMHSAYETMGADDQKHLNNLVTAFWHEKETDRAVPFYLSPISFRMGKYGEDFPVRVPAVFKVKRTMQLPFQCFSSLFIFEQGQHVVVSTDKDIPLYMVNPHHVAQLSHDPDVYRFGRGQTARAAANRAGRRHGLLQSLA